MLPLGIQVLPIPLYTVWHWEVDFNMYGSEIRRSPPNIYETLWKMRYSSYQLVQDFFHQQY